MKKQHIKAAVLGGIVVFIWGMFSWMVLPWHQTTIRHFRDEKQVEKVLLENAPVHGIYFLPNIFNHYTLEGAPREKSPMIFASIQPELQESDMFFRSLICIGTQIIGAFLIVWILSLFKSGFWKKVVVAAVIGFLIGFLGLIPSWNWWGFPFPYVAVTIADTAIAWFLGGLVISRLMSGGASKKS